MFNFVKSKYVEPDQYIQPIDSDLTNIFEAFKGRIRLGTGVDGARGENIQGEFQVFTCGAAGTTTVVAHSMSSSPIGFLPIAQNGFGAYYMATTASTEVSFATLGTSGTSHTVFLLG